MKARMLSYDMDSVLPWCTTLLFSTDLRGQYFIGNIHTTYVLVLLSQKTVIISFKFYSHLYTSPENPSPAIYLHYSTTDVQRKIKDQI